MLAHAMKKLSCVQSNVCKEKMKRTNILYIHSHDTGRYIQPYGHAIGTPHLQKLAEEGVLFRQNFCVNPTCSPSRAALLTGCYPHENGMLGLAHRGFSLNDYQQHIIHTLHREGYLSVLAGQQHIATRTDKKADWQVIGYDRHLEEPQYERAAEFLTSAPQEPFFLSVGFTETHREFPAPGDAPDNPGYCLPPTPLSDTPQTRQDIARFKASARILDHKMGIVFAALNHSSLADNTLVICTTDHGIAFPRMKCNLHDSGIGVMLIIRGPGGFTGGKIIDSMTSHLDIFPTICDLLQIKRSPWLRGKSLLPLVRENVKELHEELFFEVNYHAAYEPTRAARTTRWKYIKRYDGRIRPVLPNCDDGESKSLWIDHGWRETVLPEESLFDLIFDPHEMNNLAKDIGHQPILADMRARMNRWMKETNDPLLHGKLSPPTGAMVNDPDGISPREKPSTVQQTVSNDGL